MVLHEMRTRRKRGGGDDGEGEMREGAWGEGEGYEIENPILARHRCAGRPSSINTLLTE